MFSDLSILAQKQIEKVDCESLLATRGHEVLSPALERGDFLTLVIVVKHKAGAAFALDTGQYPAGALPLRSFRLFPGMDAPLELNRVPNPSRGRIGESQSCAIFVLDLEVPKQMPEGRLKLEPALWVSDTTAQSGWLRYPMEIRILPKEAEQFEIPPHCKAPALSLKSLLIRNLSREGVDCLKLDEQGVDTQFIVQQRRLRGKNK